jgi:hypothetical protein
MERLPSKIPKLISNILLSSAPPHTDNTTEPLDGADLSARMEKQALWNSSPTPLKSRSKHFDSRHQIIPPVAYSTKLYTPKVTQRSRAIKPAMNAKPPPSSGISISPPRGARSTSLIPQREQPQAAITGSSQIVSHKIPSELHSEAQGISLKARPLQDSTQFSGLDPVNQPSANPTYSNPPPHNRHVGRDKSRNSPPNPVNHPRSKTAQPQNGNNLNVADSNSSMLFNGPNRGSTGLISGSGLSSASHRQQAVFEGGVSGAATDDLKRSHIGNQSRETGIQAIGSINESNQRDADLTGDAAGVSGMLGSMTNAFSKENTINCPIPISYSLVADGAVELHGTRARPTDTHQVDKMYHQQSQQIRVTGDPLDTTCGMCAPSSIVWSER